MHFEFSSYLTKFTASLKCYCLQNLVETPFAQSLCLLLFPVNKTTLFCLDLSFFPTQGQCLKGEWFF